MRKKYLFLLLIGIALLLALIFAGLMSILSQDSKTYVSKPTPTQAAHLNQKTPTPVFNYPDPTNQNALPAIVRAGVNGEIVLLRTSVTEGRQIYE